MGLLSRFSPLFLPLPVFRHFPAACGGCPSSFDRDLVLNPHPPPNPPLYPISPHPPPHLSHCSKASSGTRGLRIPVPGRLERGGARHQRWTVIVSSHPPVTGALWSCCATARKSSCSGGWGGGYRRAGPLAPKRKRLGAVKAVLHDTQR